MTDFDIVEEANEIAYNGLVFQAKQAMKEYSEIKGIDPKYYDVNMDVEIANDLAPRIAMNYLLNSFLERAKGKKAFELGMKKYIEEFYGKDYMLEKLKHALTGGRIRAVMLAELFDLLQNTDPYRKQTDMSFWLKKANEIPSNIELQWYLSKRGVNEFVERYAPDWNRNITKGL